ncbi:MAG: DUF2786 domain-containing protein [Rhodopila sp.]
MPTTDKAAREAQLARIRGLMAKTVDNGCTEAEAKSAAEAVDRLLGLYEIDMDEVTAREQEIGKGGGVKLDGHPIVYAASMIAKFTDCRVWMERTKVVYFGFKVDTEISDYLTMLFRRAIDREIATVTLFNTQYEGLSAYKKSSYRTDFGRGMAGRLGERLGELKSKRDFTQRTSGRDLVMIKFPLVEAALRETGIVISSKKGRGSKVRDTGAFNAGRSAANSVAINQGIAARAEKGGRLH